MDKDQVKELFLQALEHEMGGVMLYEVAISAARNEQLKRKWREYLEQTRRHVRVLQDILQVLGIDPATRTAGRAILSDLAKALMGAIDAARAADPASAELVACECIVLAEVKDHLDWELLSEVAKHLDGGAANMIRVACSEVEDEEDQHLYYTRGWCRDLWLESLGLNAVLPPPEQRRHVSSGLEAARAEHDRNKVS